MKSDVAFRILAVYFSFYIPVGFGKPPNKIQGGESAKIKDFPSHVSIRVDDEHHHCGGTIISKNHVLTAAHCTVNAENQKVKNIRVVSGIDNQNDRVGGIFHDVTKIINHKKYNRSNSLQYDISILKLKKAIIFDATRRSISLPTKSIPSDSVPIAIGFGKLSWSKFCTPSAYLQKIPMHVITNDDCQGDYNYMKIFPDWVCAFHGLLSGICPGDSGGPLILGNEVVGIAVGNFHKYHGHTVPDIYTRVYDYLPWINDVMLQY